MRAAVFEQSDTGGTMVLRDLPVPEPGEGELLVRVRATALNRGELLQRRRGEIAAGAAPPRPGDIEFAGEVASLGLAVAGVRLGDRVIDCAPGSHAGYLTVDQRDL